MTDPVETALGDLTRLLLVMLVVRQVKDGALTEGTVLTALDQGAELLKMLGTPGAPPIIERPLDDADADTYRTAVDGARDRAMRTFALLMEQP